MWLQIYQQRKRLAYTLQDARGVASKLKLVIGAFMHILFGFVYLVIFDVSPSHTCSLAACISVTLVSSVAMESSSCSS